jgi:hypothetical protein
MIVNDMDDALHPREWENRDEMHTDRRIRLRGALRDD